MSRQSIDHKGQVHTSFTAMCRYWDIPRKAVYNRLMRGASLEEALEKPLNTRMEGTYSQSTRLQKVLEKPLKVVEESKSALPEKAIERIRRQRAKEKNAEKIREYQQTDKESTVITENDGEKIFQEFIEILLELVKLFDRLLDLDEKELGICTDTQHRFVIDFRNLLATFASRLQNKEENLETEKTTEKVILAEYLLTEEVDADDDSDGGRELLYLRHTKMDRELC